MFNNERINNMSESKNRHHKKVLFDRLKKTYWEHDGEYLV